MLFAYIIIGLGLACGIALSVLLNIKVWSFNVQALREFRRLPREERRRRVRILLVSLVGYLAVALLIGGAYLLGAWRWGSRVGAELAIGVFVVVLIIGFGAAAVVLLREIRHGDNADV